MWWTLTYIKEVCIFSCGATAVLTEVTGVLLAQRNMEIWIVFLGGSSSTKFYCLYSICKIESIKFSTRNCFDIWFVFTYLFSFLTYCFRCKPELQEAGVGFNSKFYVTPIENHFLSELHPTLATCTALSSSWIRTEMS